MSRRFLPLLLSCSILLATVCMLAGCGSDEEDWLGLNPRSVASARAVEELGDAVLSYFNGQVALEELRVLVGPSAQEGLTQMLAVLHDPISVSVEATTGFTSSTKWKTVLRFVEAEGQQPVKFTITSDVQPEGTTIKTIEPYNSD